MAARGTGDYLFRYPNQEGTVERWEAESNEVGFCFVVIFNLLFPKQILLVKGKDGQWQILP